MHKLIEFFCTPHPLSNYKFELKYLVKYPYEISHKVVKFNAH